jgi:Mg2+-importing ATPase
MSPPFWSVSSADLLGRLESSIDGLSTSVAARRLVDVGPNRLHERTRSKAAFLLFRQFSSPIVLLLGAAALLSAFVHDSTDAYIILLIVVVSGLLGFWQEHGAANTVERLLAVVELKTNVRRDGRTTRIPTRRGRAWRHLELSAGSGIPADCRLLVSRDLFVNEATLTGETFPVEKLPADVPEDASLAHRTHALFMGTHVISGSGRIVVVETGGRTEFGRVSQRLRVRPPETFGTTH